MILQRPIAPEDEARAGVYAVLARLYASGPDAPLLATLGGSAPWPEDGDNPLAMAWNTFVLASAAMDVAAADQEYTELFIGVGRSTVDLHASHWVTGAMSERPLVAVRADLARLGSRGAPDQHSTKTIFPCCAKRCECSSQAMATRPPASIADQRAFFDRHIASWIQVCCTAICECPLANYYVRVGQLTSSFMAVERDSLAID